MGIIVTHAFHNVPLRKSRKDQIQTHSKVFSCLQRSNSFFRDMSAFILTKNPTQCRSYHQKYENKYKFPHRIIRQEKEKLNLKLYEEILAKKQILLPNVDK
jgi:hypothetical protein